MASTYSSDTKLELITTGEKAGQWGGITNTNLQILEQVASGVLDVDCLLYTSPSPRDLSTSRMPSSA